MFQLQPEDFRPLIGHPRLRALSAPLGSKRKNAELKALLDLPPVKYDWSWRDD
jgi:hypothetical protein